MDGRQRRRLLVHLRVLEQGMSPIVERHGPHIQCGPGCSDCCHQTFRVSEIEGAYLREGLADLPPEQRRGIGDRARDYVPDARNPCPVLDGAGRCQLYEHRPRICRKYGIPLWSPDCPHQVTTCPKNFRDVTDIDADLILEPQAEWARDWIQLRDDLGLGSQENRTIAAWILSGGE